MRVGPIGPSPSGATRLPRTLRERLEIGAGAERAVIAGEHRDACLGVGVERAERIGELLRRSSRSTAFFAAGRSRITVVTGPRLSTRIGAPDSLSIIGRL